MFLLDSIPAISSHFTYLGLIFLISKMRVIIHPYGINMGKGFVNLKGMKGCANVSYLFFIP